MSEMFEQCRALMETMMSGAGSWMVGMMPMGGGMMPMGGGMMPMGGGMILIGLVWLTLLVAATVLIAWLILRSRGPRTDTDARQLLDVRYARGELDRETYVRMRADLTDHVPAAR